MSFDIWLFRFSKGELCEMPRGPVQSVIQGHVLHPNGEDCFDIRFPDGSHVEMDATGLLGPGAFDYCIFYIRRTMSGAVVGLVYDVAKATGGLMIPTMERNPCILVDASQRAELPVDFDLPVMECHSAEELGGILAGGFEAWCRYRDYVLGRSGQSNPPR